MSMCRVVSCVDGKGCLLWPVCSFDETLLVFALLHFVCQGQTWLLLQISLDFYFYIPIPYDEKDIFWGVLVLEGLIDLHRIRQLELLQHLWWGIDMDNCDGEWLVLEIRWAHSVFLRLHPSSAFQTFVDYEGSSISSKGFLPTVVDIMSTWIKFTYSCLV